MLFEKIVTGVDGQSLKLAIHNTALKDNPPKLTIEVFTKNTSGAWELKTYKRTPKNVPRAEYMKNRPPQFELISMGQYFHVMNEAKTLYMH